MAVDYNSLVSAVQNTIEDDGAEFTSELPRMIDRVEERLCRLIDSWGLTQFFQTSLTPGDPFVTKPTGTLAIKSFQVFVSGGTNRAFLVRKTPDFLTYYWPDRTSTGTPKYYSDFGYDQVLVAPAPASGSYAEMAVVVRPTALSAGHTTNYFTSFASDALFYGVMYEANLFIKNWEGAQAWTAKFQEAVAALNNEARRQRRDDMAAPEQGTPGPNTLMGDP